MQRFLNLQSASVTSKKLCCIAPITNCFPQTVEHKSVVMYVAVLNRSFVELFKTVVTECQTQLFSVKTSNTLSVERVEIEGDCDKLSDRD